jgi:hypothetical protein
MNVLWYWMLEPLRGGIVDTPDRSPAFVRQMQFPGGERLSASLYLDSDRQPLYVKIRALDVVDDRDSERFVDLVQIASEHMLSVLKLTWSPSAQYLQMSICTREADDGGGAQLEIRAFGQDAFDAAQAEGLYEHTLSHRHDLRLIADSISTAIPIQYRFLSLYKFLEHRFMNDEGHWDFEGLEELCQPHLEAFNALATGRSLRAELMHLRDRCAHIMTGSGKKRRLGVSALHPKALKELTALMPVLSEMCRTVFNRQMDGLVVLTQPIPWNGRPMVPETPHDVAASTVTGDTEQRHV